jgi:hypothetical protein
MIGVAKINQSCYKMFMVLSRKTAPASTMIITEQLVRSICDGDAQWTFVLGEPQSM